MASSSSTTTTAPTAPSAGEPPPWSTACSPRPAPKASGVGTHDRVRHDRIDKTGAISLRRAGRMHHISIGRSHAHKTVIVLIHDLDVRVMDTTTGEVLRALTLDPSRGYQPRFK